MGLSRQEYWSGLTFSSPGKLPNLGIELGSPAFQTLQTDSLPDEQSGKPKLQLKIRKKIRHKSLDLAHSRALLNKNKQCYYYYYFLYASHVTGFW